MERITIRFSVEKLGPEAEISIWNSGQGISPEALPLDSARDFVP